MGCACVVCGVCMCGVCRLCEARLACLPYISACVHWYGMHVSVTMPARFTQLVRQYTEAAGCYTGACMHACAYNLLIARSA